MQLFLIIAAAAVGAIMMLAVFLPFWPAALGVTGRFLCRGTEKFEVLTTVASHHQPGERSLSVYCNDYGRRRDVKLKSLGLAFLLAFAALLPFAAAAVVVIAQRFAPAN